MTAGTRPRPAAPGRGGATTSRRLPDALVAAAGVGSTASGASPCVTLLAAFTGLLARYTGEQDLTFGAAAAGREIDEAAGPEGYAGDALVLRVDVSGDPDFRELLRRVRATVRAAHAHRVPFDVLVEHLHPGGVRMPGRLPLVSVLFQQDDPASVPFGLSGLDVEPIEISPGPTRFDLVVTVRAGDGGVRMDARYDADLFDAETIDDLLAGYETFLAAALADSDLPVGDLPLMTPGEVARMLLDQNDTAQPLPHGQRLHDPFERQAARTPDAVAAVSTAGRHTFVELDARANRIAHELRELGVGQDVRVALCLPRGVELLVATLAVLKAGGAFVPVDPGYPAARIDHMLGDSGARVVLTRTGVLPGTVTVPATVTVLALDEAAERIAARSTDPPPCRAEPDDLCYVIYTSGSTGVPKGIALRHRGVLNNLLDLNRRFGVGGGDSVLALSSPSFDMSVYELIGVPGAGGTVVLPDERRLDPAYWLTLIAEHGVTVWNSVPALLTLLMDEWEAGGGPAPASLRVALLGGDWIPVGLPDRLRAAAPGVRVVSLGGATEASIHSTVYEIGVVDPTWTSIPYGRPLANQLAVVLDERMHPVPVGVAGNLYLGGIGLARGYLAAAAAANARFVTRDLPGLGVRRLYLTGDRARWRRTGELELIGRIDAQVKLNGVRIELGEVEAALRSAPGVRASAAAVLRDEAGEQVLVGYVVPEPVGQLDVERVRSAMVDQLPAAMRPGRIVRLDALPLSPNGKVDRRALPWREPDRPAAVAVAERRAATAGRADETPLLRPLRRTPHADHTLVCLPYGGGTPAAYQSMAAALPGGIDLWSVDLPGHDPADRRSPVPLPAVLPACADEIARRITGPVTLYGHDAGAAAAVALARELVARDRPVTATFVAAGLPDADPIASASTVIDGDDDQLLERLRSLGGFDGVLDDGDLGAVIGLVRHDLAEAVRFFLREELGQNRPVRLAGPLHVVVGGADPATVGAETRYREWERYAEAVTLTSIPGAGHYFVAHQPAEVARIVGARLATVGPCAVAGSRDGTGPAPHP